MRPVQLFKLLVSVLPQIPARVCACHKLQESRANIRYYFLNTALVPGQNICYYVALLNATQGCVQKSKVIENVLPWIPVHNGKRQQEKGSRAKHSLEACIFEHSHGVAVASCWTLSMLGKNISSRQIDDIFSYFSGETDFDISCKLSPEEAVCMKYQSLFALKIRKISSVCRLLKMPRGQ